MKINGSITSGVKHPAIELKDSQALLISYQSRVDGDTPLFTASVWASTNFEVYAALEALFIAIMASDAHGEEVIMAAYMGALQRIEDGVIGNFVLTDKDGKQVEPQLGKLPDLDPKAN